MNIVTTGDTALTEESLSSSVPSVANVVAT
jgi:hypothetical protein